MYIYLQITVFNISVLQPETSPIKVSSFLDDSSAP